MKQTIEDYIRHDEKFRQALLKQEGGIMKFWAQHPDSDFDFTLFDKYEKQIVGDYLQENKRNRSVHSLPPDELKRKALAWYHLEERELHHQLALQPILAMLPDEVREHANRYFEDYLTDSYRQFIQYTYRDDISSAEFYRMVIGKFSVGGLARDCLDFVLKEHHHPEVWMRTKGEYSILREFYVQRYCSEVIRQRGVYRKLREGVKEKLNGKSDVECRREAIKMMKMVKGFSRMIYSSAETHISDCTGKYIVDKDFLRKLVNGDTALRLWSHTEVPPLHECFFHYVITLEDIGRIWAAQLLTHGIDMHELEKETGAILYLVSKPTQDPDGLNHDNYKYYVDKDFNDPLDDQCCIYDEKQAKELLEALGNKQSLGKNDEFSKKNKVHVSVTSASQDKVGCDINSKAEQANSQVGQDTPPPPSAEDKLQLPENVDGSRPQKYFKKAINKEEPWIIQKDGCRYEWVGFKKRAGKPLKVAWAYFCAKVYDYNYRASECKAAGHQLPAEELEDIFGMNKGDLRTAYNHINHNDKVMNWMDVIDQFFSEDQS